MLMLMEKGRQEEGEKVGNIETCAPANEDGSGEKAAETNERRTSRLPARLCTSSMMMMKSNDLPPKARNGLQFPRNSCLHPRMQTSGFDSSPCDGVGRTHRRIHHNRDRWVSASVHSHPSVCVNHGSRCGILSRAALDAVRGAVRFWLFR